MADRQARHPARLATLRSPLAGLRSPLAGLRSQTGTVRLRTTLTATAALAIALVAGGAFLVVLLRHNMLDQVRTAVGLRAQDVAAGMEFGTVRPGDLPIDDPADAFVQVVDSRGTVVDGSPNVAGLPPLTRLRPGEAAVVRVPFDEDDFIAVAATARTPEGTQTVVVARALDGVGEATDAAVLALAVWLPVLLVVAAAITWRVIGRALSPVEAIRREVDEISAADLHRRIPAPTGDDEIARLARTMNRMLGRIEASHARQRRFVSDASHELRSPIASIRQQAEVARAHPHTTTVSDLAANVLADNARVQQLVEDLLLLARADEHTLQVRLRPLDLDDLVLEEARRLRESTRLRIDTTQVSAARVLGDPGAFQRVLRNLADNAARHAESRITLSLAENDDVAMLAVGDDGPGIPEADRERVFDRFVRLDNARDRDTGGSGLGLAIVSELVAAHAGTIAITDSPLGGARVELTLPCHLAALGPPVMREEP